MPKLSPKNKYDLVKQANCASFNPKNLTKTLKNYEKNVPGNFPMVAGFNFSWEILMPTAPGNFPGAVCGKFFSNENTLKIHIQGVHEKVRFKCDICGNDFSQPSGVRLHKKNVHKIGSIKKDPVTIKNNETEYKG